MLPPKCTLKPVSFRPHFSDDQLATFKKQLHDAYLPPATYASKQEKYGTTHEWMESTLKYWRNGFDWRKREERINSVDHYKVDVSDGLSSFNVHFVAHFSENPDAIPLLFLHGWPGSFLEFIDVINILKTSTNPSFHLICPSQLGYGWSDNPPLDRGYGMYDSAKLVDSLMCGLGFTSGYAAQGGDIGSVIARILAVQHGSCKTININYMPIIPPESLLPDILHAWLPTVASKVYTSLLTPILGSPAEAGLTPTEIKNARKAFDFAATGRGYGVMQGTRPGTIGLVIQTSPVALLAWLGEKFRDWTDGGLSVDEVLETATMWYILGSFPNSIYAYSELTSGVSGWHRRADLYIRRPFGMSSFAKEIASPPRAWAAQTGNLVFWRYHEKGGHFAALENPIEFAEDMRDCFRETFRKEDATAAA